MIVKGKRPGGYKAYTRDEMEAVIGAPLLVEDYEKADKVILLLMQPQVKLLLDATPVGKRKAKNSLKGIKTVPSEFLARPLVGPDCTNNLASLLPFKVEGSTTHREGSVSS